MLFRSPHHQRLRRRLKKTAGAAAPPGYAQTAHRKGGLCSRTLADVAAIPARPPSGQCWPHSIIGQRAVSGRLWAYFISGCREPCPIIYFADFADFSEKAFAFTEVHAAGRNIENSLKPNLTFSQCPEFPCVVNPEFPSVANPEFFSVISPYSE